MTERGGQSGCLPRAQPASAACPGSRPGGRWVAICGALSLLLFFVPLIAPLLQTGTLACAAFAAWRRSGRAPLLVAGAAAAMVGMALTLALQYVWVV
jgi:hypothetical protein